MIDYLEIALSSAFLDTPVQKYHGQRNDGFITDVPKTIQLADDDYVRVRYDAKAMRFLPSRPSRIKYSTARKLINQYRKKYAERLR